MLKHYARALELKPDLARAYMYRGVLLTQMGDLDRACAGHTKLLALNQELAATLDSIMAGTTGRDLPTVWPQISLERVRSHPRLTAMCRMENEVVDT